MQFVTRLFKKLKQATSNLSIFKTI